MLLPTKFTASGSEARLVAGAIKSSRTSPEKHTRRNNHLPFQGKNKKQEAMLVLSACSVSFCNWLLFDPIAFEGNIAFDKNYYLNHQKAGSIIIMFQSFNAFILFLK